MAAGKVVVYADGKFSKTGSGQDATIDGNLIVAQNLTVNGTTTTINSTTLAVDDKNIELGSVDTPSDATADGGGITLKGDTDHTILWTNSTDSWDFSEHINLASGKQFKINGSQISSSDLSDGSGLQQQPSEGAFVNGDKTKLDGIESGADVTDATNVTSSLVAATSISPGDQSSIQSNLGVDAAGTDNSTDVTLAGSYDYLTISTQTITLGQIDLTTDVTGSLPDANVANDLTIDGGTVDNSIIGGSTAAAGTFTDLTANDSLTVNAGVSIVGDTANEITLSAKAATSQSVPIFKLIKADNSDALAVNQNGGLVLGSGPTAVSSILDEDNMASDSATALATQQSIKAYVDSQVSGSNSFSLGLNADASGVSIGDVVIIDGSGNVTTASNNNASYILGVAANNASSGNNVSVFKEGNVIDLGQAFSGSSPAVGDPLFLGTDGQTFTVDAPTSGEIIRVGTVITTAGKLLFKVQHIMSN